jgi:hypothetical protein
MAPHTASRSPATTKHGNYLQFHRFPVAGVEKKSLFQPEHFAAKSWFDETAEGKQRREKSF